MISSGIPLREKTRRKSSISLFIGSILVSSGSGIVTCGAIVCGAVAVAYAGVRPGLLFVVLVVWNSTCNVYTMYWVVRECTANR